MAQSHKSKIIKFAWRHNLIYPIQLLIWLNVRKSITMVLDKEFQFSKNLLFTLLMFFSEFVTGLTLFFYQKSFLKEKTSDKDTKEFLIYTQSEMKRTDSDFNIFFLIFTSSYFDFVQFILSSNYIPKFLRTSESLDLRLSGVLTISSALFFYYLLKLPILKHQYFSLLIIGTCLIIIVITEYIFQGINIFINYGEFTLKILLIIFKQLFLSLHDSNQKYVIECNYVSYFLELAIEGFIGLFITLIYLFTDNTFKIPISFNLFGKFRREIRCIYFFIVCLCPSLWRKQCF